MHSRLHSGRCAFSAAAALLMILGVAQAADEPAAAPAAGMDGLIAKARQEGGPLVYGAPSQDKMEVWFKAFQAKYGITVEYYRAPTNPVYQRFSQEQQVGKVQADAMVISERSLILDAVQKGWIAEYVPSNAGSFPADATIAGHAYPLYVAVSGVGWNTRVVPADLQAKLLADPLGALLDPRFVGKIALVSITAGGPQIASNANIALHQAATYGWPYLEKLSQLHPAVLTTTPSLLDAVIAGDYWASPNADSSVFAPKVVDGAPIALRLPEVSAATPFYVSVVGHAPHPNAARLFEEWATSLEAQSLLADISQSEVVIKGWQDDRAIRKQAWYAPPKELWFGWASDPALEGQNLKDFYARWQGLFGRSGTSN